MVKLMKVNNTYADGTKNVELYADAKADVSSSMVITGLSNSEIAAGSVVYTKALDIGVFDSTGTVNWG